MPKPHQRAFNTDAAQRHPISLAPSNVNQRALENLALEHGLPNRPCSFYFEVTSFQQGLGFFAEVSLQKHLEHVCSPFSKREKSIGGGEIALMCPI